MKTKCFLICLLLLVISVTSCDKGHKPPPTNPFHLNRLRAPENLTATWEQNKVFLNWEMSDTDKVAQFAIFMSDTSGIKYERFVPGEDMSYVDSSSWTDSSVADSVYYHYQVAAVDSFMFIGPKSNVVSVLVP